jgi:hypothetical protein
MREKRGEKKDSLTQLLKDRKNNFDYLVFVFILLIVTLLCSLFASNKEK